MNSKNNMNMPKGLSMNNKGIEVIENGKPKPVEKVEGTVAKGNVDVAKEAESTTPEQIEKNKIQAIRDSKRKSSEDWKYILEYKIAKGLKRDDQLAEVFKVSVSNIQQQRNKLKNATKSKQAVNLTPKSLADTAKELLAGVDKQLAAFDAKVAEAKTLVDNAAIERKKIEDSKKQYEEIIKTFS